ncbi:MAG: tautomerase family protein [Candidatus Diapherotrites archaeon]|nr:tautomerase family protein [Candidatus Diapherotrites archaeon]
MPVVEIKWWKGRTKQQKEKIVREIFRVFEENGVKKEDLQIIIFDVDKADWATNGKLASDL